MPKENDNDLKSRLVGMRNPRDTSGSTHVEMEPNRNATSSSQADPGYNEDSHRISVTGQTIHSPDEQAEASCIPGMPAQGEFCKVFLVGCSIMQRAYHYAQIRTGGEHLGLDKKGYRLYWRGQSGMCFDNIVFHIKELMKEHGTPDMLIVHCGAEDIVHRSCQVGSRPDLEVLMKGTLCYIKETYPNTTLVWSQILPRRNRKRFDDKSRFHMNRIMSATVINQLGGRYIKYTGIAWARDDLFLDDEVHLSDAGNNIFLDTIQQAIELFHGSSTSCFGIPKPQDNDPRCSWMGMRNYPYGTLQDASLSTQVGMAPYWNVHPSFHAEPPYNMVSDHTNVIERANQMDMGPTRNVAPSFQTDQEYNSSSHQISILPQTMAPSRNAASIFQAEPAYNSSSQQISILGQTTQGKMGPNRTDLLIFQAEPAYNVTSHQSGVIEQTPRSPDKLAEASDNSGMPSQGRLSKVFLVGCSIIQRAYHYAQIRTGGEHLGLDKKGYRLYWRGQSGMCFDNLTFHTKELVKEQGTPDMLIVHCGSEDMGQGGSLYELQGRIKDTLGYLAKTYPNTILVWSQMLPRPNCMKCHDKSRMRLNSGAATMVLNTLGGRYVKYPEITKKSEELFLDDAVHLNDAGYNIFLNCIQGAIEMFHCSTAVVFPDSRACS